MVIEELKTLASRASEIREYIKSEEGSKTSLVLPMLGILGYDVFNPKHLMAELTADVGIKRGEKVDYALMSSGKAKLIIECKKIEDKLEESSVSQLFRYFTALRVKFGVLTNGIVYKFYSDLESPNIMDGTPFFEFNLVSHTHADIEFLMRFKKGSLVGQMKSLIKECKKRKLRAIIRDNIRNTLELRPQFILDLKKELDSTSLCSSSKKEVTQIAQHLVIEECLRTIENSLDPAVLEPKIRAILKGILGNPLENSLVYRQTPSSVFIENPEGAIFIRVFSNGLDLKISFSNKQSQKSLRVIDDLYLYRDKIKDLVSNGQ